MEVVPDGVLGGVSEGRVRDEDAPGSGPVGFLRGRREEDEGVADARGGGVGGCDEMEAERVQSDEGVVPADDVGGRRGVGDRVGGET